MRTLLGVLMLLAPFFFSSAAWAQSDKDKHDGAVVFASEFCKCLSPFGSKLDKDVYNTIIAMPTDPQAAEDYFNGLDESLLTRLVEQLERFETFEQSPSYVKCMEDMDKKMERFQGDVLMEDPQFLEYVMEELGNSSRCQLAYILLYMGLQSDEE